METLGCWENFLGVWEQQKRCSAAQGGFAECAWGRHPQLESAVVFLSPLPVYTGGRSILDPANPSAESHKLCL